MLLRFKKYLAHRLIRYVSYDRLKDEVIRRDLDKAYKRIAHRMIEEFYRNA